MKRISVLVLMLLLMASNLFALTIQGPAENYRCSDLQEALIQNGKLTILRSRVYFGFLQTRSTSYASFEAGYDLRECNINDTVLPVFERTLDQRYCKLGVSCVSTTSN